MITATLFLVFAVITILGMPIALALVGGGMAAIVAGPRRRSAPGP